MSSRHARDFPLIPRRLILKSDIEDSREEILIAGRVAARPFRSHTHSHEQHALSSALYCISRGAQWNSQDVRVFVVSYSRRKIRRGILPLDLELT